MPLGMAYLDDVVYCYRKHKELAEQAMQQVADQDFFHKPGQHSNSIAAILKHVAGNLASRWTDFQTTDGDENRHWLTIPPGQSQQFKVRGGAYLE